MSTSTGKRFTVAVAPSLRDVLAGLKKKPSNIAAGQLYTCVQRCATQLLPGHATDEGHLLTGPMRGVVYRVKQGRLRVFYTIDHSRNHVVLLDVLFRKKGDKSDAYEEIQRRIRHGDFDPQFTECGHRRPAV